MVDTWCVRVQTKGFLRTSGRSRTWVNLWKAVACTWFFDFVTTVLWVFDRDSPVVYNFGLGWIATLFFLLSLLFLRYGWRLSEQLHAANSARAAKRRHGGGGGSGGGGGGGGGGMYVAAACVWRGVEASVGAPNATGCDKTRLITLDSLLTSPGTPPSGGST